MEPTRAETQTTKLATGLCCPSCGNSELPVVSSYRPVAGLKFRYRKCTKCGAKWRTKETFDNPPPIAAAATSTLKT
jgi:transcriptional regulator NrdR family protein